MESREVGRSTETLGGHSYWPGQKSGVERRGERLRDSFVIMLAFYCCCY